MSEAKEFVRRVQTAADLKKDMDIRIKEMEKEEKTRAAEIKKDITDKELAKNMYETMFKIRRFEEETFEFYKKGLMAGLAHLYLGEEAIATGVCKALRDDDYIASTHRGHGHLVARGSDVRRMMAEILGKETGYSKGKGGSMHIMDMTKNIIGANGIVGGGIPIATGAGYGIKLKGTDQVSISFFGDSASNQGTFHESVNMAAAWDLPVIYVIENNLFGISVDMRRVTKEHDLYRRAIGYGIPSVQVFGNDVYEVYEAAKTAVERARKGEGPTIIECMTYRWQGHHVGDPGLYRAPEELAAWKDQEPLLIFKAKKILTDAEIKDIEDRVEAEIQDAVKFAIDSPMPEAKEAFDDVFLD